MKINELKGIVDNILTEEVKKYIMEDMGKKPVYHIKCDDEPIDTFETEDKAIETLDKYKKEHPGKQLIIEPEVYESYEDMIDKLDKMSEIKDMKNNVKESKKSIIVTESQMKTIIKNVMNEDVPGVEVTKKAQAQTKKEAAAAAKEVETKLKKASTFDGNDNPEFPKQIGKGEKKAFYNTEEENEYVEDYRGGGMQDIEFDEDPGEGFHKRQQMYLKGDKLTGNSQDAANVVKSDLGDKIAKNAERKAKKVKKDPMYVKDPQPVKIVKDTVNEDIKRMKDMFSYNKKTQ